MNAGNKTDSNILLAKEDPFSFAICPEESKDLCIEPGKSMGILDLIESSRESSVEDSHRENATGNHNQSPPKESGGPRSHYYQTEFHENREMGISIPNNCFVTEKNPTLAERFYSLASKRDKFLEKSKLEKAHSHRILSLFPDEKAPERSPERTRDVEQGIVQNVEVGSEAQNRQNVEPGPNSSTQNQNNGEIAVENNTSNVNQQPNINLIQLYEPETKIYLTKVIVCCIFVVLFSILLLLRIYFGFSLGLLFLLGFIYLGIIAFIDYFWTRPVLGEIWLQSDEFFKLLDVCCATFSLLILAMRMNQILAYSVFSTVVFVLAAFLFHAGSESPPDTKLSRNGPRIFCALQGLFFTLRLDDFIDCHWAIVFTPSWIYFTVNGFDCLKYVTSFLRLLSSLTHVQNQTATSDISKRIIGTGWLILYHGWNFVAIFCILGFIKLNLFPYNANFLANVAYLCIGLGIFQGLYTYLMRKSLFYYIATFRVIDSWIVIAAEEQSKIKPKQVIAFETEKRESYFVMLSSSYFMPLSKSFAKGKNKKQDNKTKGKGFKTERVKKGYRNLEDSEEIEDHQRKDLQVLDKKCSGLYKKGTKDKGHNKVIMKLKTVALDIQETDNGSVEKPSGKILKPAITLGNIENIKDLETGSRTQKTNKDEEVVCYICYTNIPNAILMDCGHGGICYECAISLVERRKECMGCRKKVEAIYKVQPDFKFSNIIKSIEVSKVVTKFVK